MLAFTTPEHPDQETFDISEYITLDQAECSSDESISSNTSSTGTLVYHQQPLLLYPDCSEAFTSLTPIEPILFSFGQEYTFPDFQESYTFVDTPQTFLDYAEFNQPQAEPTVDTKRKSPFPDQETIDELFKTIDGDELVKRLWSPEMYGRRYENGRNWYCCHLCDKLFTRSVNLKSHVVADHWKLRPIQCTKCDARFARKHDCKRHMRLVHSK